MNVTLAQGWLVGVMLTSVRVGVLLLLAPIFGSLQGLVVVRALFVLALSALLTPTGYHALGQLSAGGLLLAAVTEAAVGFALAYGMVMAFSAFAVAGKLLDIQTGLGMGNVYDPVTRHGAPMFGTLLNMLGLAVFYELDGHHLMLRGIAYSLQKVPPGHGVHLDSATPVLMLFGMMFALGVALIAPVLLSLLLIEVGLAVVSKALPQMNVFTVSTPAKSLAGLALLALSMPLFGTPMLRIYASIFEYWEGVMG
jgi:flagellar biosynthetic protein FliR